MFVSNTAMLKFVFFLLYFHSILIKLDVELLIQSVIRHVVSLNVRNDLYLLETLCYDGNKARLPLFFSTLQNDIKRPV